MKEWYETLFENYAKHYDKESFTSGTAGECDFIEKEFNFNKSGKLLDLGCGTGRHSIELLKRGYKVTGVDLSESMLNRAREKASKEKLDILFEQGDARELKYEEEFDMVIMICEGAFPLMETDEMNFEILFNIHKALKADGKLIFTTLNALFPLFHSVKDFMAESGKDGDATYTEQQFDLMTFRETDITTIIDDDGKEKQLKCNTRYYTPSEITWLLKSLGFKNIAIHGATLGAFSRADQLRTNDYEMLVIAEKGI
ncbi:MAG: class I SAM-dependent methyltransferase [Cyclobacteriaceae bacterium]